jgi:hypothetical protein
LGSYNVESPIIRFGVRFAAALLIVTAPFAEYGAISQYREARGSVKWPKVPGTVGESRVERQWAGTKVEYLPHVLYRYSVANQGYTGTRIRLNEIRSTQQHDAEAVVAQFPVGSAVTVFYNPRSPGDSTLEPGVTWRAYAMLVMPAFMVVLGILFWFAAGARKKGDPIAASAAVGTASN